MQNERDMTRRRGGQAHLLLLLLPLLLALTPGARAQGRVSFSFGIGWVAGSVMGMATPGPFSFRLDGSFAEHSTALVSFDLDGMPSLTVEPVDPQAVQYFAFNFGAGPDTPSVQISRRPYAAPTLRTFDRQGALVWSAPANGRAALSRPGSGPDLQPSQSPVAEPAAVWLALAGLAAVAGWVRWRGA